MAKDILRNRHASVKFAKENNMEWFGIVALLLLLCYSAYPGKTELSCNIIDVDDEWIKICYTEKKDKQVVKLMRIENIESIEEQ